MRGMSDAQRTELTTAVEQLAWTVVREMLELEPDAGPRSDVPDADLRHMWLAALTSLLAIRDSAEQLAASAALSAAQRGGDFSGGAVIRDRLTGQPFSGNVIPPGATLKLRRASDDEHHEEHRKAG